MDIRVADIRWKTLVKELVSITSLKSSSDRTGAKRRTLKRWMDGESIPNVESAKAVIDECERLGIDWKKYLLIDLSDESSANTTKFGLSRYLPPPRVFLCHAKEDAHRIEKLYHQFEREGLDPWYDKKRLKVGDRWEEEIIEAIEQSDFFAVFLSKTSVKKTGFIQNEIRTAAKQYRRHPQGRAYLLPVRLEDCEVPRIRLDENTILTDLQWIDLFNEDQNAVHHLAIEILAQWERTSLSRA
jgi:hypothetical protein